MPTRLTYKRFKEIIEKINNFQKDAKILSDILVRDSVGFVDFGDDITNELVKILEMNFDDTDDSISWWLWEARENRKYVWDKERSYDLNKLEDFYNYLNKDLDKVPSIIE